MKKEEKKLDVEKEYKETIEHVVSKKEQKPDLKDQEHAVACAEQGWCRDSLYNLLANLARKSDPRAHPKDGQHQPRSPPQGWSLGSLGPDNVSYLSYLAAPPAP